jgi:hypothetical protein
VIRFRIGGGVPASGVSAVTSRWAVALSLCAALDARAADTRADRHGFVVVDGAEEMVRKGGPRPSVQYYVREAYPAPKTIATLTQVLDRSGWRAVTGSDLSPHEDSSLESGWEDAAREAGLRLWTARWLDANGDEVYYSLVYGSRQMAQGMEPVYLSVTAWFDTKDAAARKRADLAKKTKAMEAAVHRAVKPPRPCPTQ